MRIRLLSRASDLATLQARLVARALQARWPTLDVALATRASAGDRDAGATLWEAADKGLFTSDLSQALVDEEADGVVHSWKDLPIRPYPGTLVAATLRRADARDVLLVRRDVVDARPSVLVVLTSSPRRAWQIERSLAPLLPWPVGALTTAAVRGNIPTRLAKLIAGQGHALIVAKAALDRLLSAESTPEMQRTIRAALDECRWMALPLKEFPTAPAQGALAVEIADGGGEIEHLVRAIDDGPTREAVLAERAILSSAGGGCHEALGASVRVHDYGTVTSVRGRLPSGEETVQWTLSRDQDAWPRVSEAALWPRRDERDRAERRPLSGVVVPDRPEGLWVSRAEALPDGQTPAPHQLVWAAGARTWEKLARRGVWVNGSAEGLGDVEPPDVDTLAGRSLGWLRLTHAGAVDPDGLPTYAVVQPLPADLDQRSHFYWTSGHAFLDALARFPAIRQGWHGSGPGRTARTIRETLGDGAHVGVWLDYEQWLQQVIR
jgi:hydroxymethylbilane synthase